MKYQYCETMFTVFSNDEMKSEQPNFLLMGCGGGYDVFCGLPLYFALREQYNVIHLGNMSLTKQHLLDGFEKIGSACHIIIPTEHKEDESKREKFSERELSRELGVPVYAFPD